MGTNLVAMVAGGRKPKFADNTVMIFDDAAQKMVLEFTCPTPVLGVRMKRDKIVIVTRNQIHVFSFPNSPTKLFSLETRDNPLGLCEVSPMRCGEREVMVFPGFKAGSIQLVDLYTTEQRASSAPVTWDAHKNELVCLAVSQQGGMVATASTKGTLIRIWDTARRVQLVELRRGADQARIHCINFSCGDEWLCCSSGAYAGSQWSLASFTVPQECACICAFGSQGHIYAVCLDGSFHNDVQQFRKSTRYHFSADGICNQASYDVITEMCEECDWQQMLKNK